MKTRFDKSFEAVALIQPTLPAIKPIAIIKTTGSNEDTTGLAT
jgi:hypothetical protein